MKEDWIKDIGKRLENHEMEAPDGLWESINSRLGDKVPAAQVVGKPAEQRKAVGVVMWIRAAAAVAAVLLVAVIGFGVLEDDKAGEVAFVKKSADGVGAAPQEVQTAVLAKAGETAKTAAWRGEMHPYIYNNVGKEAGVAVLSDNVGVKEPVEDEAVSPAKVKETESASAASEMASVAQPAPDTAKQTKKTAPERKKQNNPYEADYNRMMAERSKGRGRGIEISASVSNGLMAYNGSSSGSIRPSSVAILSDIVSSGNDFAGSGVSNPLKNYNAMYGSLLANEDIHHDIPVQFGFMVRYPISSRMALESGLTYTHLRSTFKSGDENFYISSVQRLGYIGVPLNVAYTLWQRNGFSVYASAGGAVAKCITGKIDTETMTEGTSAETATYRQSTDKPWQLSLNGAAGIQYSFVRNLSLYAEPSLSYYFNDGSSIDNYYSDHPLSVGIRVGLRLQVK